METFLFQKSRNMPDFINQGFSNFPFKQNISAHIISKKINHLARVLLGSAMVIDYPSSLSLPASATGLFQSFLNNVSVIFGSLSPSRFVGLAMVMNSLPAEESSENKCLTLYKNE